MDIQKDKDFTSLPEIAKLYQACKERDLTIAEREYLKGARDAWQAAKAHEAEKLKGCVLVPVQCPDPDFADSLFDELSKKAIGEFGDDLLIHFSDIDEEKIWALMAEAAKAQAAPEGYVLVKKVHPDAIVHNQGLGLFKECQVIYGWDGKSKDFKEALNKGFYHGVKLGAKAVLETAMIEAQEPTND